MVNIHHASINQSICQLVSYLEQIYIFTQVRINIFSTVAYLKLSANICSELWLSDSI